MEAPIKQKMMKNSGTGGGISMTIKKWKVIMLMVEKMVFGPGDARLVEDITGKGHTTATHGDVPCVTATVPLRQAGY